MTTAVARRCIARVLVAGAATALLGWPLAWDDAEAISIDNRGEVRLGLRSYTAARIGTQRIGGDSNPLNWPESGAGHLRQNRYFVQLSYDHNLTRLAKESRGLLAPFRLIDPSLLAYTLEYRFEGETLYDWGPSEYQQLLRHHVTLPRRLPERHHSGSHQHHVETRPPLHQGTHRPPAPQRAGAQPAVPGLPRLREGPALPAHRPPEPRLGRDRRLPADRQHQSARRQLRRVLHRTRRAARSPRT